MEKIQMISCDTCDYWDPSGSRSRCWCGTGAHGDDEVTLPPGVDPRQVGTMVGQAVARALEIENDPGDLITLEDAQVAAIPAMVGQAIRTTFRQAFN